MAENPTTNHSLDRPLVGSSTGRDSEDWGSELNTNFAVIDNKLVVVDQDATVGDYTPFTDALFYAYDTEQWYRGDGTDWIATNTSGPSQTFDTLTLNDECTLIPQSSAPSSPTAGMMAVADGTNWDPTATGNETIVAYLGGSWTAIPNIEDTTDIVTNGSDLQTALDNYEKVTISGTVDVTDYSPIEVGNDRIIIGYGTFSSTGSSGSIVGNDLIIDNSAGPTLHANGNDVRLFGFGLENSHADGIGVRSSGYSFRMSHCDIEGQTHAILCNAPDGSSNTPTEPRINYNRLSRSGDTNAGSIGVYVQNQHDAKITNNIINGYEIGIQIDTNSAYVFGNHIYPYPAPDMSTGISSMSNNHRIVNNRCEGSILDHGIEIGNYIKTQIIGNLCQVENDDANGIYVGNIGGWLTASIIMGNMLQTYNDTGSGAGQAINATNVDVFNNTVIANNIVDGFANHGALIVTENAGADTAPTSSRYYEGQVVENTSDNTIWMKLSDGTMVHIDNRDLNDGIHSLTPQSAAPTSPTAGMITVQDGTNWDPATTGNETLVVYLNGTWTAAT